MQQRAVTLALVAMGAVTATALLYSDLPFAARAIAIAASTFVYVALIYLVRTRLRNHELLLQAIADGISGLHDRDYSVSIATPKGDSQLQRLVTAYNGLGATLRAQRQDLYQRELLLDTVIQASPLALVLTNATGTILYGNLAARQLFGGGQKLEGLALEPLLIAMPGSMRDAMQASRDSLFTTELHGESQVFHISQRQFLLNGQPHRLRLLKQLTREVTAQEVAVWKKVIRVIAHEINNSVAPIASLAQSGQRLVLQPDTAQLQRVFSAINDRMSHLSQFVDDYSRFAKLPKPRCAEVNWRRFLKSLQTVTPFAIDGLVPTESGWFDESQLEQVMINLLKNAAEAGSPGEQVEVGLHQARGGWALEVRDRGGGMTSEVMANALLPFYSTKPAGSGLGLTLCREIIEAHGGTLDIGNRADGAGVIVRVWLPSAPAEAQRTIGSVAAQPALGSTEAHRAAAPTEAPDLRGSITAQGLRGSAEPDSIQTP